MQITLRNYIHWDCMLQQVISDFNCKFHRFFSSEPPKISKKHPWLQAAILLLARILRPWNASFQQPMSTLRIFVTPRVGSPSNCYLTGEIGGINWERMSLYDAQIRLFQGHLLQLPYISTPCLIPCQYITSVCHLTIPDFLLGGHYCLLSSLSISIIFPYWPICLGSRALCYETSFHQPPSQIPCEGMTKSQSFSHVVPLCFYTTARKCDQQN